MQPKARNERGLSESTQWAVLFSLLMLLTLGIIQAGIYLHSRNVAQRAATSAVDVARGSYGTIAEAEELASGIARSGGLRDVSIRVARGATSVTADVSGDAPAILDIGVSHLHETASAPLERATQP